MLIMQYDTTNNNRRLRLPGSLTSSVVSPRFFSYSYTFPLSRGSAAAEADVEGVAQGVTDEAEGDDGDDEDDGGRVNEPPVAVEQFVESAGQHRAPVGVRWRQAQAEETEGGQGQDGVGDAERGADHDHAHGVGDQVPEHDPARRTAHGPGGQHELAGPQRDHLAPDQPGHAQPGQDGQQGDDRPQVGRQDVDQDQEQDQPRDGQQGVDHPHHDRVDDAAGDPGDGPVGGAEDRGRDGHREPEFQRGLPGHHQPPEHVEAGVVGAQEVVGPGGGILQIQMDGDLVGP